MFKKVNCLWIVAAFLLFSSPQVMAAESASTTTAAQAEEETTNTSKKAPLPFYELPSVTVIGSNMPIDIAKYTGSVTVLQPEDLIKYNSLEQALRYVSGVNFSDSGLGRPNAQYLTIRGFSPADGRVIIMQDGVKRDSNMNGFSSSLRTDPTILKTVEVVKGSSSILHGSGAIGGILATETKDPQDYILDDKWYGFELESRVTSQNFFSQAVTAAVDFKEFPIDFMVHYYHSAQGDLRQSWQSPYKGGKIENNSYDNSVFLKLGADFTDEQRLEASYSYYRTNYEANGSMASGFVEIPSDPWVAFAQQDDFLLDYAFDSKSNDLINFKAQVYYSQAMREQEVESSVYRNSLKDDRYGFALQNLFEFNTGDPVKHKLVFGADYQHRRLELYHQNNTYIAEFATSPSDSDELGIFLQDDITIFDFLTFTLGLRYDYYAAETATESYSNSAFSPRVGVALEIIDGLTILGNYSQSFRSPSVDETFASGFNQWFNHYSPNTSLEPETSKEIEIGLSLDRRSLFFDNDHLYFKAMYFDANIENMIDLETVYGTVDPAGPYPSWLTSDWLPGGVYNRYLALGYPATSVYRNVNSARRYGVEIDLHYTVDSWDFFAGYEHLRVYDTESGENLANYSDKLRYGAAYTYTPWDLTLAVDVIHWFNANNTPSYYTSRGTNYYYVNENFAHVNARLTWRPENTGVDFIDNHLEVSIGANNLFNQPYATPNAVHTLAEPDYSTGIGATYYANVKIMF